MSSEPTITLTITIPEDAIRGIEDVVAWAYTENYRAMLHSRDIEEALRLKQAIVDIANAINAAKLEVQP